MSEGGEIDRPETPAGPDPDPAAVMAAWRARGADRVDPVRFRFIEALARRAQAQRGEVRSFLDGRLAKALAEYAGRLEAGQGDDEPSPGGEEPSSPLAQLVAIIARPAAENGAAGMGAAAEARPELKSLRYFRDTWARLSVDQQLAQALAEGPENAGPLNSHRLVLQSIEAMRDISPDYTGRFLTYVDALLWLERADGGGAALQKKSGRARSG